MTVFVDIEFLRRMQHVTRGEKSNHLAFLLGTFRLLNYFLCYCEDAPGQISLCNYLGILQHAM